MMMRQSGNNSTSSPSSASAPSSARSTSPRVARRRRITQSQAQSRDQRRAARAASSSTRGRSSNTRGGGPSSSTLNFSSPHGVPYTYEEARHHSLIAAAFSRNYTHLIRPRPGMRPPATTSPRIQELSSSSSASSTPAPASISSGPSLTGSAGSARSAPAGSGSAGSGSAGSGPGSAGSAASAVVAVSYMAPSASVLRRQPEATAVLEIETLADEIDIRDFTIEQLGQRSMQVVMDVAPVRVRHNANTGGNRTTEIVVELEEVAENAEVDENEEPDEHEVVEEMPDVQHQLEHIDEDQISLTSTLPEVETEQRRQARRQRHLEEQRRRNSDSHHDHTPMDQSLMATRAILRAQEGIAARRAVMEARPAAFSRNMSRRYD